MKSARMTMCALLLGAAGAQATMLTGNPTVDGGWVPGGHSLANGTYVKGSANYGFDTFSAAFTVQPGSDLEIADAHNAALDWVVGDTVLGVGGLFSSITPAAAGWGAISGGPINAHLPSATGPKLQVKFGTADATWFASTLAPSAGNGNSSSSSGGGRVQVRTSAYFQAGSPNPGQTEPWTWDGNSGELLVLDKDDHIDWSGVASQPSKYAARMIWEWNDTLDYITSWELLLNVSLLERQAPGAFAGPYPAAGDMAILTVQDGDGVYTDALVTVAPEPGALALVLLGGATLLRRRH